MEKGAPWQNGSAESFNGRFRDECLHISISDGSYSQSADSRMAEERRTPPAQRTGQPPPQRNGAALYTAGGGKADNAYGELDTAVPLACSFAFRVARNVDAQHSTDGVDGDILSPILLTPFSLARRFASWLQ